MPKNLRAQQNTFRSENHLRSELEQYETTLRSAQANFDAQKENIRSLQAGVQSADRADQG